MKKNIFSILLFISMHASFACSCSFFSPSAAIIEDLLKNTDLAVVGHPITNIDSGYISPNPKYMGTMLLFKVDVVLKGELTSDTIFINQETQGNCSMHFMPKQKYVLFGNQIKNYKTVDTTDYYANTGYSSTSKILKFHDYNNEISIFENLTKKYYTITTNQCISFSKEEPEVWEYFNLKK